MTGLRSGVLAVVGAGVLLAGCGTDITHAHHTTTATGSATSVTHASVTPGAAASAPGVADATPAQVIRGWAQALAVGDIAGAASYFALPSVFANGAGENGQLAIITLHTAAEARAVNASLSCGARVISTTTQGRYTIATFRLINRRGPGADCGSGTGLEAATAFVIRHGRIVDWIRAPDPSSLPANPPAPPSNASTPGASV